MTADVNLVMLEMLKELRLGVMVLGIPAAKSRRCNLAQLKICDLTELFLFTDKQKNQLLVNIEHDRLSSP